MSNRKHAVSNFIFPYKARYLRAITEPEMDVDRALDFEIHILRKGLFKYQHVKLTLFYQSMLVCITKYIMTHVIHKKYIIFNQNKEHVRQTMMSCNVDELFHYSYDMLSFFYHTYVVNE